MYATLDHDRSLNDPLSHINLSVVLLFEQASIVTSRMHQMTLKELLRTYGRFSLSVGFYLVQIGPVVHWIWLIGTKVKFCTF